MNYYLSLFTGIFVCDIKLSQVAQAAECKPWQEYYPKYAVAVAECRDQYGRYKYIVAKSTPPCGHDEGYHAEEILIRHLARTRQLADVETIYITYSPCSSCTTLLLGTFRLYKKPNIKFLCIYGKPGARKHEGAIRSLKLLIRDGFQIHAWDITTEKKPVDYLTEAEKPRKQKRRRMEMHLERCKIMFQERARNTRSMIEDIKSKLHKLYFCVGYPKAQVKVFTSNLKI